MQISIKEREEETKKKTIDICHIINNNNWSCDFIFNCKKKTKKNQTLNTKHRIHIENYRDFIGNYEHSHFPGEKPYRALVVQCMQTNNPNSN